MAIPLAEKVVKILRENPHERFTSRGLAEKIVITDAYKEEMAKKARESGPISEGRWTLVDQVSAEIASVQDSIFKKSQNKVKAEISRPRKYYYTEENDEQEIEKGGDTATPPSAFKQNEEQSYAPFMQFLQDEMDIYCKRIDDKKSKKRDIGINKWLHPDIVGLEYLSGDWHEKVKKLGKQFGAQRCRLWSFEVKTEVERRDVRDVFFQAVANSSWAHYGYLVGIFDQEVLSDLKKLSSLHGIGVIQYNLGDEDSEESNRVVIPARERSHLDWESINRLALIENRDFLGFIENVIALDGSELILENSDAWDHEIKKK